MPSISANDQLIVPTTRNSFSPLIITFLFINQIIGSAPNKLGKIFDCGVILAPIFSILIAGLTAFSLYIITKAIAFYHLSTPDELIDHIFGRVFSIIFGFLTVTFYLLLNVQYYGYISNLLSKIILSYKPNTSKIILDPFFLNTLLYVFFIIPVIHTVSLKMMFFFSIATIIATIVIIASDIYSFASYSTYSNNKSDKIIFFRFNHSTIFSFTQMISLFQLYPFNYPGIRHLKRNSVKIWMIVVCRSILFSLIVFLLIGEYKYFIKFYNVSDCSQTMNLISSMAQIILLAASFPATMNPARFTIQNCFLRLKNNNFTMWYFFGYCFQTTSLVISSLYHKIDKYVNAIISILSAILSFLLPSILYLNTFKFSSLHLAISSILIILIGLGSIALNILDIFCVF